MKIGLQNFQGLGAYTEILVKPITLFYGPNSAGKSTIADAIEFLSGKEPGIWTENIERHARNTLKERVLEKGCYKGKADDVVLTINSHFLRTDIWGFSFRGGADISEVLFDGILNLFFSDRWGSEPAQYEYQLFFSKRPEEYKACWQWKDSLWYLRESILLIDGLPFFRFNSEKTSLEKDLDKVDGTEHVYSFQRTEVSFNIQHPSWEIVDKIFDGGFRAALEDLTLEKYWDFKDDNVDKANLVLWLGLKELKLDHVAGPYPPDFNLLDQEEVREEICGEFDPLSSPYMVHNDHLAHTLIRFFMEMPIDQVRAVLGDVNSIQPIRSIPDKKCEFSYKLKPKNMWPEYYACWPSLAKNIHSKSFGLDAPALHFVNYALSSPDFMDTGYTITGNVKLSLDLSDAIDLSHREDRKDLMKKLQGKDASIHPYLVYKSSNLPVEITDVGVGISQMIPVLWACWHLLEYSGGVHIQQPELHLHPKLQAQLGDLFIQTLHEWRYKQWNNFSESSKLEDKERLNYFLEVIKDKHIYFLLESHSEHLLLRLLRRIRESNQVKKHNKGSIVNCLNSKNEFAYFENSARSHSLTSGQVSVVYVNKDKDGMTTMKQLRLAEDGEFIDRWPDGFFSERDADLFGDEDKLL